MSARLHGRQAIAYLPTGVYNVSETLTITGSNYLVGGSGFLTKLYWRGGEGGTIVEAHEPDRVTLQHISIGNHDVGPMNNAVDVLQTGSAARTHMTYESVFAYGMYQKEPFRKGLHLRGLGPEEIVVLSGVQGNLRVIDSAAATILARTTFEGSVIVEGTAPNRNGFLGFLTRLSTITRHGLYVRDNHSIVMNSREFSVVARLENDSSIQHTVSLVAPWIEGYRLADRPEDAYYLVPRRGAVFNNAACNYRERYCGLFPLRFLDTFNPTAGRGLALRTSDRS